MSAPHGMPLVGRVFAEYRRLVIGLAIALVANLLIYALIVYPLGQRVANVEQRDLQAEQALAAAQRDREQAAGTLGGKDRAATELTTFYREVLPADEAEARRLTFLRIRDLADQANLGFQRGETAIEPQRERTLQRLRTQVVLSGSWNNVRSYIYQLETAPEFVVIDNVELAEAAFGDAELVVTVDLSTYFRGADAAR